MGAFVKVGKIDEFREGRGRTVRVGDERVAVFRVGDRLHAMQDACPHMGASLGDYGTVGGGRVECHWHHWSFDLVTGACAQRDWARAATYEVKVEGGEVWVRAADPPPPPSAPKDDEDWVPWRDEFLKGG
jgi:NAD(P)H-dependent nitrite reductase small subunit